MRLSFVAVVLPAVTVAVINANAMDPVAKAAYEAAMAVGADDEEAMEVAEEAAKHVEDNYSMEFHRKGKPKEKHSWARYK